MKVTCHDCGAVHELAPPTWVVSSGKPFPMICPRCKSEQDVFPTGLQVLEDVGDVVDKEAPAEDAAARAPDEDALWMADPDDEALDEAPALDMPVLDMPGVGVAPRETSPDDVVPEASGPAPAVVDEEQPFVEDEPTEPSVQVLAAADEGRDAPGETAPVEVPAGAFVLEVGDDLYHVPDLATLQRWVVERRVHPDDRVHDGSGTWAPARSRPDLRVFFDAVARVRKTGDATEVEGLPVVAGPPPEELAHARRRQVRGRRHEPALEAPPVPVHLGETRRARAIDRLAEQLEQELGQDVFEEDLDTEETVPPPLQPAAGEVAPVVAEGFDEAAAPSGVDDVVTSPSDARPTPRPRPTPATSEPTSGGHAGLAVVLIAAAVLLIGGWGLPALQAAIEARRAPAPMALAGPPPAERDLALADEASGAGDAASVAPDAQSSPDAGALDAPDELPSPDAGALDAPDETAGAPDEDVATGGAIAAPVPAPAAAASDAPVRGKEPAPSAPARTAPRPPAPKPVAVSRPPAPRPEPVDVARSAASAPVDPAPVDAARVAPERARPTSYAGLVQRGWDAIDTKDLAEALVAFEQAVRIDGTGPDAHYGFGYALIQKGRLTQGRHHLCRALPGAKGADRREILGILRANGLSCE